MFTILVFVAGLFLGKYWDQVNAFIKSKLDQSKNSDGGVNRLDDQ